MAEASDLESRIRALLDRGRNRRPLSRRAAIAIAAAVAAVLLPFAAVTAHAQARGALSGVVQDPSGARVPNCRVTAKNLDGANQETTVVNPAGEYRFASIPSGRYSVEFSTPGFVLAKVEVTLVAGATATVDAHLAIGSVNENVVVHGQKPPAASGALPAAAAQRIRVGGSVTPVRLIRQPKPAYPAELQQLGVEGTVVMKAIISKNGTVLNPTVVNTVDPRLAKAALDAVSQWQYEPALLNGEPVETVTTITLDFQLGQ
jgi:TonB family protein